MREPKFSESHMVTAMCLWEAWMELVDFATSECSKVKDPSALACAEKARQLQENHGVFTIRAALVDLVIDCDDAWAAVEALEGEAPTFDWEWCPQFVRDALTVNFSFDRALERQYMPVTKK